MKVLHRLTPSEIFKTYKSKLVVDFDHWLEPLLFWQSKTKWIDDTGTCTFQITPIRNGPTLEYGFQIYDDSVFWSHKNSWVKFYYNVEDLTKVYLFEKHNYNFIGVVNPTLVLDKKNKKEILKIHRNATRKINEYRKRMKKQDENIEKGLPADFAQKTPNLDAAILKASVEKGRRPRRERGEVDITNIKLQTN